MAKKEKVKKPFYKNVGGGGRKAVTFLEAFNVRKLTDVFQLLVFKRYRNGKILVDGYRAFAQLNNNFLSRNG